MGRVIKEVEQGEKTTETTYQFGRKDTVTKPDGVTLFHTYDGLGRLSHFSSSDQTIDYTYHYDSQDNLLKVEDLVHDKNLIREYDHQGRMIKETLPNGQTSAYAYDIVD